MKNVLRLFTKYCYFTVPIFVVILIIIIEKIFNISSFLNSNLKDLFFSGTCTILGFLITAISIFAAFNKNSKFMELFKQFGHDTIFYRSVIVCGISCIVIMVLVLFDSISSFFILKIFSVTITEICLISNSIIKTSLSTSS